MFLLMNPIAAILVARGHGLIAVIRPKMNADQAGKELYEYMVLKNSSIKLMDQCSPG